MSASKVCQPYQEEAWALTSTTSAARTPAGQVVVRTAARAARRVKGKRMEAGSCSRHAHAYDRTISGAEGRAVAKARRRCGPFDRICTRSRVLPFAHAPGHAERQTLAARSRPCSGPLTAWGPTAIEDGRLGSHIIWKRAGLLCYLGVARSIERKR